MFDFPATPLVGDEFTAGGVTYAYTGTAWDLKSGGSMTDYVLKAGDTMTGGLSFGPTAVAAANDHSKHLLLWSGGTNGGFGLTVTSGRLNFNVDATSNSHFFRVANADKFQVHNTGAHVLGNLGVDGHVEVNGNNVYIDRTADGYGDSPSLEFRRGSTRTLRLWSTVSNNTGYGDYGGFEMSLIRGSHGTHRILKVAPAQGAPTLETCPISVPSGSITLGSGDSWGMFLGDSWHGWVWSNTSNCEHLRSYQGKFEFRKTNAVTPGELLATIDTAGVATNMVSGASFIDRSLLDRPELCDFIEGDDDDGTDGGITQRRGVNLSKVLLQALDRIKALEADIAALQAQPRTQPQPRGRR